MTAGRKIAVITDVHANLPALEAAMAAIAAEGVDAIYHTGDAIAIGPYPAECLDRLLHTPNTHPIMGNHDPLFAQGLPDPVPDWISPGELEHQRWTHAQLDGALREVVAQWPYRLNETFGPAIVGFQHYALDRTGREFLPIVPDPTARRLDRLFGDTPASLVFYGHHHPRSDLTGKARYVNSGALGCSPLPEARFALFRLEGDGTYDLAFCSIPYVREPLFREMDRREVPGRAFIRSAFYGQS